MIFWRLNQFLLFLKDRQKTSFKPARGLNLPGLIHGINLVLSYTIYRFCPDRFHIYGKKTVTGWDLPGLGPETRWMISRLLQDTIFYKDDPLFIPFACIFFLATWYYGKKKKSTPGGQTFPVVCLKKRISAQGREKGPQGVDWTARNTYKAT